MRTVASLLSGIPEHKIHVIAPDIGGGFGNKVGAYPGYICAIVASIVTGVPVKWVEDRIENLSTTAFARDYHMTSEIAATKDGRVTGLRVHVLADHGALRCLRRSRRSARPACSPSSPAPTTFPIAHVRGRRRLHQQGAGRRRLSLLVPRDRGRLPDRAHDGHAGAEARASTRPSCALRNFIKPRAVSLPVGARLGVRLAATITPRMKKAMEAVDYAGLRAEQAASARRSSAARRASSWASASASSPRSSAPGPSKNCDILGIGHVRQLRDPRASDRARRSRAWAPRSQGQGHETTYAQIIATEIGIPADDIVVEEGDTDTAPYGLGTYGSRSTPVAGRGDRAGRAQDQGTRRRRSPPTCSRCTRAISNGTSTASGSRACPRSPRP